MSLSRRAISQKYKNENVVSSREADSWNKWNIYAAQSRGSYRKRNICLKRNQLSA